MRASGSVLSHTLKSSGRMIVRLPCFLAMRSPLLIASRMEVSPIPVRALASSGDTESRSESGTFPFCPNSFITQAPYPFFSLAKSKRTVPIDFRAGKITIRVEAVPEHGMATIWDADVLIWAASQIVEARDGGLKTSRLIAATSYEILTFVGRGTTRTRARVIPTVGSTVSRRLRSGRRGVSLSPTALRPENPMDYEQRVGAQIRRPFVSLRALGRNRLA